MEGFHLKCFWCEQYTPKPFLINCQCGAVYCFSCFYYKVLGNLEGKCFNCKKLIPIENYTNETGLENMKISTEKIKSNEDEMKVVEALIQAQEKGRQKMACPYLEFDGICKLKDHIEHRFEPQMLRLHKPEIVVCPNLFKPCDNPICPYQHPNLKEIQNVIQKDTRKIKLDKFVLIIFIKVECPNYGCPFEHKR
ncbi:hypothetical protein M0811_02483 [Anaeramoeba ignava]|uniref:Uncharacterized protein n=1 Tax=Anaeramoeba ignava TaxID=1746090 RepID=A0A9Q0L8Z3_ANAIG|nr:hypothetical protein M0811_02483 [Anaeramoeba ignava]